jgi:hypothetical protein
MTKSHPLLLLGATLLALTAFPVSASPVIFDLSDVDFTGGTTATGSFSFDSSTDTFSDVNVIVSGPNTGFFDFFAGGAVAFDAISFSNPSNFELELLPPVGAEAGMLNLFASVPISSITPSSVFLNGGTTSPASSLEINNPSGAILRNGSPNTDIETLLSADAALVPQTATPEPTTLGILLIALGAIIVRPRKPGCSSIKN